MSKKTSPVQSGALKSTDRYQLSTYRYPRHVTALTLNQMTVLTALDMNFNGVTTGEAQEYYGKLVRQWIGRSQLGMILRELAKFHLAVKFKDFASPISRRKVWVWRPTVQGKKVLKLAYPMLKNLTDNNWR